MVDFTFGPVGALHRPAIRRAAKRFGVTLSEIKDWGQSQFTVTGSTPLVRAFHEFLTEYAARNDALDAEDDAREAAFQQRWRVWDPRTWSKLAQFFWLWLTLVLGLPATIAGLLWLCGVRP